MKSGSINISGANENNLKNVNISLPTGQIVSLSGVSGSGKSTVAHQILGRVGRRRLGRLRGEAHALFPAYQPRVRSVEGLPACVEIRQEPLRGQNRSTIATYTGLSDLLAKLFMRFGKSTSVSGEPITAVGEIDLKTWLWRHQKGRLVTVAKIVEDKTVSTLEQLPKDRFYIRERSSEWQEVARKDAKALLPARWWIAEPYQSIKIQSPSDAAKLVENNKDNTLWVIGDVFIEGSTTRLSADDPIPYEPLTRRLFSFNTSGPGSGKCKACDGLGVREGIDEGNLIKSPTAPFLEGGLNLPQSKEGRFTHLGVLDDIIRGLLKTRGLPENVPWAKLPAEVRNIIMHGSGSEPIPELPKGKERLRSAKRPFQGVMPLVKARARSTGASAKIFQQWITQTTCPECSGSRFNKSARACEWRGHRLVDIFVTLNMGELSQLLDGLQGTTSGEEAEIVRSIIRILSAYERLNLGHLSLNRATSTLSGGESQRLKLGLVFALQITNACYLLDEPSRGLHPRDVEGLVEILRSVIKDRSSIVLVEHNPIILQNSDHVVTLGPGGGQNGGRIISQGKALPTTPRVKRVTSKPRAITKFITVEDAKLNNLRGVSFGLPLASLTAVVGVSGAGKSSAILGVVVPAVKTELEGGAVRTCKINLPKEITFVEVVGQKLAGQNRRSIVATTLEIFDQIREHFAGQTEAKVLRLGPEDFSFNSSGACNGCAGTGVARDGFGEEIDERCHVCSGTRFSGPALFVRSGGLTIAEFLDIPIAKLVADNHCALDKQSFQRLSHLSQLGLGHLSLNRATPTLSAGERQRLALARFLSHIEGSKPGLLVLDEPTAGLSLEDACRVFELIKSLTQERGHTAVVLEHKMELLPIADWILEFGPKGGPAGGKVIYEGTFDGLSGVRSPTSEALKSNGRISVPAREEKKLTTPKQDIHWAGCANVFEALAVRSDIHEEVEVVKPVHPAVFLKTDRFPNDVRVGEILELLSPLRENCEPQQTKSVRFITNTEELTSLVSRKNFGFSPVSPQLRLGLATPSDLKVAVKALAQFQFSEAILAGSKAKLVDLPSHVATSSQLVSCLCVCPSGADAAMLATSIRWSQGVIHLLDENTTISTQYLNGDGRIGLAINSPFVGDYRSPHGRCSQCLGSGKLPVYEWALIVADETRHIGDDKFWNPAVLDAIRSVRRTRMLPEAEFFSKQLVANFLTPPARMDSETRFLFEYGIPWRRFLKPSADRNDREQDYYSWRGLHDYVYVVLGRVEDAHKERLKATFQEKECPRCAGTGMGWEALCSQIRGTNLADVWREARLSEWKSKLGIAAESISAALSLGLGDTRANDRFADLAPKVQDRLLAALATTAKLTNLALVASVEDEESARVIKTAGMHLVCDSASR